jgi:succinate dehydrogenase / fumarate reductase iron-sulfur subunit
MTRLSDLPEGQPITVEPMQAFPVIKDLVTDVSWNYEVKKKIKPFAPRKPDAADGTWRMDQRDVDRVQEFRKCIECFLCQDVCHVIRDHQKTNFAGPRFLIQLATLDMHPLDTLDRREMVKDEFKIGLCNITKCCTEVCPESIHITDNGIIPLKERVADDFFDPVRWVVEKVLGGEKKQKARLPMFGEVTGSGGSTVKATPAAKRVKAE